MTNIQTFDAASWRTKCASISQSCEQHAMTPMHFTMLLSQKVEDQLRSMPITSAMEAIEIATDFGYETSGEVAEMVNWVAAHARCKFGKEWGDCSCACDGPCGRGSYRS